MIQLFELTRKTRIVNGDYTFDGEGDFISMLPFLTPKFDGNWQIALVDPSIKYAHTLADNNNIPSYVDCYVYMSPAKIEQVVLKHPSMIPKKQKPWDAYMEMISELSNTIEPKAAKYLYKAIGGDTEKLKEALLQLDNKCESGSITLNNVKEMYTAAVKPVFSTDVVLAFFMKDAGRWRLYEKLVSELGERYSYYTIRKNVFKWLNEKAAYLKNEETTIRFIDKVDAPFISYVNVLFSLSNDYRELSTLMYEWDNRDNKVIERRTNAYIQ